MKLIGLMSGTSVDGIDAALVEIQGEPPNLQWNLEKFLCVHWEAEMRLAILDACRPDYPISLLTVLNFRVAECFAEAAQKLADFAEISLDSIDAIASHGQTVWHQPTPIEIGGKLTSGTLQIGDANVIAIRTGCTVVADFRTADVAVGGQGAPLVPFADFALFSSSLETRCLQNLGGIANVTILPQNGSLNSILAFDTGPGNMLLDSLTEKITEGKQRFDNEGKLAAQGEIYLNLLHSFLDDAYYRLAPPKSTGREKFGKNFAEQFYQKAKEYNLTDLDILATATALTSETIAIAYEDWLLPKGKIHTVILGGGGVHNRTLLRQLSERLPTIRFTNHAEFGLPDDAKEAVAFAILGYETLNRRPSNVPCATGAKRSVILGKIVF